MGEAVKRISTALNSGAGNEDLYSTAVSRSFVLSVDQGKRKKYNPSSYFYVFLWNFNVVY